MRLLLSGMLLTALAQADVISHTVSATDSGDLSFSAILSVPQFNPALGTLNSMSYRLGISGQLTWEVITFPSGAWLDFFVTATTSFLGATQIDANDMLTSTPLCIPGTPGPCAHVATGLRDVFDCPLIMGGTLSATGFQFSNLSHCRGGIVGSGAGTLATFTGNSQTLVPVSTSVLANPGAFSSPWTGAVQFGQAQWDLSLTYNYTPTPPIHAPEPRWLALPLLCALLLMARYCTAGKPASR